MYLALVLMILGETSVLIEFCVGEVKTTIDSEILLNCIFPMLICTIHDCFQGQGKGSQGIHSLLVAKALAGVQGSGDVRLQRVNIQDGLVDWVLRLPPQ